MKRSAVAFVLSVLSVLSVLASCEPVLAADSWIQMPDDTGNTGKKSATISKTDGADTVHVSRTVIEDGTSLNQAVVTAGGALKVDGSAVTQPVTGAVTPADAYANPTTAQSVWSLLGGWNGATWDRLLSEGSNADADPVDTTGALSTHSHTMMFNGTTWDRMRGDTTSGLWTQIKAAPQLPASLGAKTTANSMSVNIASDQIVPTSSTTPAQQAAGIYATNTPNQEMRVMDQPHQLMVDGFDAALDTTNRWNTPTVSGTGSFAVSSGALVVTGGTGYAYDTTKPSFMDVTPGQLRFAYNIQVEASPFTASTYRFWGAGTPQAAPSTAGCPACTNTMVDAVGFEINTDQKMYAVVYKSGVRTAVADVTASAVTDGTTGNFSVFWRPVKTHWFIGSQEVPVATGNYVQSALNKDSLPAAYLSVGAVSISSNTMSVSDTAKNGMWIGDKTFGWRGATVKDASVPPATTDTSFVVAQSPNGGNPCLNPSATLTSVYNGATSGTSNVQIVALSGTTKIYVCSASVIATSGTTPTFALIYGTGSACATGTGNITFPVLTSTTVPNLYAGPTVGMTPAGNALCYVQTGTTPINKFILTYVQQ